MDVTAVPYKNLHRCRIKKRENVEVAENPHRCRMKKEDSKVGAVRKREKENFTEVPQRF